MIAVRVLGVDLSLASTGVAAVRIDPVAADVSRQRIELARIQTKGSVGATVPQRLARHQQIIDAIQAHHQKHLGYVDLIVIEGPSYAQRTQAGEHERAGLWWRVAQWAAGCPLAVVPPSLLKKYAAGKGNAAKDAVLASVIRRYPFAEVDGNDVADALVLAAMGARALGHPIDDMPKVHIEAMTKVAWPERGSQ